MGWASHFHSHSCLMELHNVALYIRPNNFNLSYQILLYILTKISCKKVLPFPISTVSARVQIALQSKVIDITVLVSLQNLDIFNQIWIFFKYLSHQIYISSRSNYGEMSRLYSIYFNRTKSINLLLFKKVYFLIHVYM